MAQCVPVADARHSRLDWAKEQHCGAIHLLPGQPDPGGRQVRRRHHARRVQQPHCSVRLACMYVLVIAFPLRSCARDMGSSVCLPSLDDLVDCVFMALCVPGACALHKYVDFAALEQSWRPLALAKVQPGSSDHEFHVAYGQLVEREQGGTKKRDRPPHPITIADFRIMRK